MSDEKYFVKRRLKLLKLRRKARRGEIAVRRLFALLRFCLIIFIFYGLYRVANCHYWYFPSVGLKPGKNIEIMGNSIVKKKKIFSAIKNLPLPKEPIYKINPNIIAREIEKLPPIKKAYVRRFWNPARLVIAVQEVIPAIVISPSEDTREVAAFSFDGEYISHEYLPLSKKTHAIKILSYGTNDDYEQWDKKKINDLYNLAKQIEYYSKEKVQYIDLRIKNNAFVQLESIKIRLGALDLNVYERIKAIPSMMASEDVRQLAANTKYIDLSWSDVQYVNVSE